MFPEHPADPSEGPQKRGIEFSTCRLDPAWDPATRGFLGPRGRLENPGREGETRGEGNRAFAPAWPLDSREVGRATSRPFLGTWQRPSITCAAH